ncbi:MAG: tetratricopeptide repeat protein [Candidatus Aminicenantes bacterium]|nr:tetratricopeptide repeat protein [Candidatus Aminicenantes bacterium]
MKSQLHGLRLWVFRLLIMILIPVVLLGLLELGLRIFGYGFKTSPMIPYNLNGRQAFCDNLRFPWRFFSPDISRDFNPFIFIGKKPANSYRIFILGSSAAQGVPDSAFAFGRILEVMLQETFPQIKFEVINTALTAVNSHAVLPIAKECVRHQADLLIVYMGNNEVVGPYGPGTVFAPFSSLALIRFNMALKALRLGQLLSRLGQSFASKKNVPGVWRGMEMFLERQIPADDPRLESVYRSFASNLKDMGRAAIRNGSAVIFCTVAANLKDCPPFASRHRSDLSAGRREEWENLYRQGIERETAADYQGAAQNYRSALGIDDGFADLVFRMGRCGWLLGDYENAGLSYRRARELDALRFRADAEINRVVRDAAAGREAEGVFLSDQENVIAAESSHGIPGEELFYDHVHLNFRGNYLAARALFDRVKSILPDWMKTQAGPAAGAPSLETCAEKLAYSDWDRYNIADEMLEAYIKKPPFTNQLYHAERVSNMERELTGMRARLSSGALQKSAEQYDRAVSRSPQDWWLHWKYAHLLALDLDKERDALEHFRRVAELAPHSVLGYSGMGFIQPRLGDADGAIDSCLRALAIDPTKVEIENTLAMAFVTKGRPDQAEARFKKAIEIQPHYVAAYTNLATLYAKSNRLKDAAEICRQGIKVEPDSVDLRMTLADSLNQMGQRDEAIAELKEAQRLDPQNAAVNQKLNEILWEKIKKKKP